MYKLTKGYIKSKVDINKNIDIERAFGYNGEDEVLPIIKNFFKRNIYKTDDRYNKYDFKDDIYCYELKTRRNTYNYYPTTLISCDKITNNKIICLFKFTDGLYYIEYDKELFNTFEKKPYVRGNNQYYENVKKDYFFIPIEKLIKIE